MNVTNIIKQLGISKTIENGTTSYGRFVIGPVNPGQGITLANALRRTLLSDLRGIAITSAHFLNKEGGFEGQESLGNHEFSTIPGMRESVFEFLLNLKDVVISSVSENDTQDFQTVATLPLTKTGIITADSIQLPSNLKVVNTDHYLTTVVSPSLDLEVELTIMERHSLYSFSNRELLKVESLQTKNQLFIEPKFSPVKKVKYIIEDYPFSGNEDVKKEIVFLSIWTNASITPEEALQQGTQCLIDLFHLLIEPKETTEEETEIITDTSTQEILIEELNLSVRSYNCLKRAQIHTVSDLLDYSKQNLLEIKNFGLKSAEEVIEALQNRLGVSLPN
jgi:DNA-directed RNA polymerase subunit alpha